MTEAFAEQAKRVRLRELEQSFIKAMQESKFNDALRFARTVLEIDPSTTRYNEFIPLLEEKVANAPELENPRLQLNHFQIEEEESSLDVDDIAEGQDGDDDEDSDDDSEDDEDSDESDSDDDEDDIEAGLADTLAGTNTASTSVTEVDVADIISLDPKSLRMSKEARSKIRESLQNSIQEFKEKELIEKLKASDPLLG